MHRNKPVGNVAAVPCTSGGGSTGPYGRTLSGWSSGRISAPSKSAERISATIGAIGVVALTVMAIEQSWEAPMPATPASGPSGATAITTAATGTTTAPTPPPEREILIGGYLGTTYTYPSTVTIKNPGRTDMTVSGFEWEAKPFKSPLYYGLRLTQWPAASRVGTMLDFTHSKAIARFDDTATFTGTLEGKPLPARAKVGDVFKHLEFSHGHNMLTLNALTRLGSFRLQPYVGAGAGISLPHTEIGYRGETGRTYEYQFAGFVGQALAGLEVRIGNTRVFVEYKLTYAPYDVPLSGVINGWLLFTDLWRQTKAWAMGEAPPGGRLTTPLLSHHAIGGAMVHVTGAKPAMPAN